MQTFLPYPSFSRSAACLDDKRLGKQIVEAYQISRAISDPTYGWQSHPAVNMWRGYHEALFVYATAMDVEWIQRGHEKSHGAYVSMLSYFVRMLPNVQVSYPTWLGDEAFHASHRSNLLRKDASHYGQFGWVEPDDLPYVWPSQKEGTT